MDVTSPKIADALLSKGLIFCRGGDSEKKKLATDKCPSESLLRAGVRSKDFDFQKEVRNFGDK